MHWSSKILAIAVAVSAIMFFGCEGPAGAPGSAGENGKDGVSLEGYAPGIQCGTCHTADQDTVFYVAGRVYQWEQSRHATGGNSDRNAGTCAGCHTTEGFVQRFQNGWTTQVVNQVPNQSPPGCFACHSPHLRANFTRRDTTAVTITSFIAGVQDAVFDYGNGNICVRCHQTRTSSPMSPKPDPTKTALTDTITITSSRWYPHYGVNGQMLMGTGGFEFVDYTYTGSSNHTSNAIIKEEGCVKCHMAEPVGGGAGKGGGHTMWIAYEGEGGGESFVLTGCQDAACHGNTISSPDIPGPSTNGIGAQTLILANLDTLKQLLVAKNWLNGSTDLVRASGSSPLKIAPAARAGALYNYFFIEHEGSEGVHNTKYAYELLRSSIAELRKP
jgi:hypothetical protein